jgi:hypothetical protein
MNVRINNNKPNAAQRKALRAECVKEFDKLLAEYNREVALQVLYILRFDFGFGQERLRKFSEKMKEMQITTIDRYEAKDGDVPYICEIKLRDSGIDVEEFLKE